MVDEQRAEHTIYNNNIGFNHAHAKRGSYYAKWILSGKHLSRHHIERGRKMALKYVGQLVDIANSN